MQKLLICRRLWLPYHKYIGEIIFLAPFPPKNAKKASTLVIIVTGQTSISILMALAKRQYSILLALAKRH